MMLSGYSWQGLWDSCGNHVGFQAGKDHAQGKHFICSAEPFICQRRNKDSVRLASEKQHQILNVVLYRPNSRFNP